MATAKDCHALTTVFKTLWERKYGRTLDLNRNKARWAFDSMLMDMKSKEIESLIDFYINDTISPNGHSIDYFFYNYEALIEGQRTTEVERKRSAELREQTKKRAEEWRRARGQG